jgi:hypothetical protein
MYGISRHSVKSHTSKRAVPLCRRPVFKSPRAYANKSSAFGMKSVLRKRPGRQSADESKRVWYKFLLRNYIAGNKKPQESPPAVFRFSKSLVEIASQLLAKVGVAQLAQCNRLDLANALAGDAKFHTDRSAVE